MLQQTLAAIGELTPYQKKVYRVVETQEQAATTSLVDNLDEQALLEALLDEVKPPYRQGTENLHYLIATPFRYPPLRYGSRFGDIAMPSYFYGSETIKTVLAECAYYRFIFLSDMKVPYQHAITSGHMSFQVSVSTKQCADLTKIRSTEIAEALISTNNYSFTQQLGKKLTEQSDCCLIRYYSARDKNQGINVAISTPEIIQSTQPEQCHNWLCHTRPNNISFRCRGVEMVSFAIEEFFVSGTLPRPA